MNHKLSVIIPFVGEWAHIMFTIQSVAQEFIDRADFEILAVDNYREGDPRISAKENKSGPAINACVRGNSWLKYVQYTDDLSHWQAKRYGVLKSTGDILLFVDSHVVPSRGSLYRMYQAYTGFDCMYKGTMHLPLTYKILEYHRLIYKLLVEHDCFYDYRFTPLRKTDYHFEVPCMSTCGMMISRKIYDKLGGWPDTLTIYGGGENFMNYTLAVTGHKKWIYPHGTLFHHGSVRDYHYEYDGLIYNRMLAHYLFGGQPLLDKVKKVIKGKPGALEAIARAVVPAGKAQREHIKKSQKITIDEWRKLW